MLQSSLSWGGWVSHHAYVKGSTALAACDYVGENIAYYLGITSPKFHYELEEHKRELEEVSLITLLQGTVQYFTWFKLFLNINQSYCTQKRKVCKYIIYYFHCSKLFMLHKLLIFHTSIYSLSNFFFQSQCYSYECRLLKNVDCEQCYER